MSEAGIGIYLDWPAALVILLIAAGTFLYPVW